MARKKSRQEQLDHTITLMQQRHGSKALRQGVSPPAIPHISTSFPELDAALGIGGIPKGRVTVITGAETAGQLTLAALVLANAQRDSRLRVAYVDLSHACDAEYLERCGVELDRLWVARPVDGRQALDMTLDIAQRPQFSAALFDHWTGLEDNPATRQYAAATLDHLATHLAHSGVALLVLDERPSLWHSFLTGAWRDAAYSALSHHAALRLALQHEEWLKVGPDIRGYRVRVNVDKNKLGPAGQTVSLSIHFNGTVRGDGI
jgi:recombination protein RecA